MKIQEIASAAGVSVATVSRVFANHPNVRQEIRRRVLEVARRYGYHPRLSVKQRNIAILTPFRQLYPSQGYVEMVLSELTAVLAERDFRIEIVPQNNFDLLRKISFRGAIGIGLEPEVLKNWDDCFASPLVNIDRPVPPQEENLFSIRSDEEQGMYLGIEYLHRNGRRKIGCILYGNPDVGNVALRMAGIKKAFSFLGIKTDKRLLLCAEAGNYLETVGRLLQNQVDAIFAPGGHAAGILTAYALALYQKKIPEEIAVVSSERTMYSQFANPPQTVISQDYEFLAQRAVEILGSRMAGEKPPKDTVLPYKLIERDSV